MGQQRSLDREVQEAAPMEGNEKRLVGDDNPLLWVLPLAAKLSDSLSMILRQRDSVTFSTASYRFDINRIVIMFPKVVAPEYAPCSLTLCNGGINEIRLSDRINVHAHSMWCTHHTGHLNKPIQGGLLQLHHWESWNLVCPPQTALQTR